MKALITWPVLIVVILVDLLTKSLLAVQLLPPNGFAEPILGEVLKFGLMYNPTAAFGLYLGAYSRWIFMALTLGALLILWRPSKRHRTSGCARSLSRW